MDNRNDEILSVMKWMHSKKDNFFFLDEDEKTINESKMFLNKHWLSTKEYVETCESIQQSIFVENSYLPQVVFKNDFRMFVIDLTGCAFFEEEYNKFQDFLKILGEKYFYVIENPSIKILNEEKDIQLRFKFPVEITYSELSSGGTISNIFLNGRYPKDFFIFGKSALWGKYSATIDFDLFVFGFNPTINEKAKVYYEPFKTDYDNFKSLVMKEQPEMAREKYYNSLKNYLPYLMNS